MALFLSNGKLIFYAHVPKTAGTSLENYLALRFENIGFNGRAKGIKRPRQRGIIPAANHLTAADLNEVLPNQIDFVFATVRDPLARLKSEYRYQFGASRIGSLGFSSWLHLVIACMKIDPRMYDNHIRPQTDLVPRDAEIFRLEDGLEAIILRLDSVVGGAMPELAIGHLLKRESREIRVTCADAALVASVFAADYERFGYPLPDETQMHQNDRYTFLRRMLSRFVAPFLVFKHRCDWLQ